MRSLQSKITLTYVLLSILIIVLLGVISSITIEDYFTRRLVTTLGSAADRVVFAFQQTSASNLPLYKEVAEQHARLEEARITLIDARGRVVLDSEIPLDQIPNIENHLRRPEIQQALDRELGSNIRRSKTVDRDFLYTAKKIPPTVLTSLLPDGGFVRVSVPIHEVKEIVTAIRWSIGLTGLGVLLVVIAVSVYISRRVTRPMMEIANAAVDIRRGNLERRIAIPTQDEIGEVARAVNELVEKLQADLIQLRRLERVRTEFFANVSHELRTPIFSLQGFLETLIDGAIEDTSVNRSFVQKAHEQAGRLDALLKDLIDIASIESGEMRMSFRYFKLNEFLRSITEDALHPAELFGVDLQLDFKLDDQIEVYGDRDRLRQAIDNLLQNAIRYNRPGGMVTLQTSRDDHGVRVLVSDTGIGIPAEHLPRIFERFYRVDRDRSREVGGTGLGLAIVKHIIEAHGSPVAVTSTVGTGSTFSFHLRIHPVA